MNMRDAREELNAEREDLIARAQRLAKLGPGFDVHAEKLGRGEPFPVPLREAPIIVDTDVGGDPDDAIALVAAARQPALALVLTCDEYGGERARFARYLLDLAGRGDVPVVAGRQGGDAGRYFCVEGMTPVRVPAQPDDPVAAAARVIDDTHGTVRWVGMGPMSNLANLLGLRPELASRLAITQMGGALAYRDPSRAEHNFRLDPDAASAVLGLVRRPELVTSDVTFRPEMELTRASALYQRLSRPDAPAWAGLLAAHCDRWFERFHPGTMQHDALTLSVALELPFVDLVLVPIVVDDIGRTFRAASDQEAIPCYLSQRADYPAFHRWLDRQLTTALASHDDRPLSEGVVP